MRTSGVVYYNRGGKCIVRMIVSLMTLRRHYDGPVTIFLEEPHDDQLVKDLEREFKATIVYRPDVKIECGTLVHKIEISMNPPYDLNLWIDSDTVITGDIREMFTLADGCDLAIPHFAGWKTDGGTISRRILRYKEKVPSYMDAAIAYGPAINTGVYAWQKESTIFKEWLELAKWGDGRMFIADEVACQVLLPRYNCRIAPIKYNVSVLHDPGTKDPAIIHFHGKKHVKEAPKCAYWLEAFYQALEKNLCSIKKYVDPKYGDKRLNRFLSGRYDKAHSALRKKILGLLAPEADKAPNISVAAPTPVPDMTVVTGCDAKYVGHLRVTLPNWLKYKGIGRWPMIVYVNGFGPEPEKNEQLAFLKAVPSVRMINWEMPEAENQRERMLSAFVLGAARDVKTAYWLKIDADAFATDRGEIVTPDMVDYALCGHKWGYSFAKHIQPLVQWANAHPAFASTPKDIYDPAKVDGKRYNHPRIASYVCFHSSEFVRMAASLTDGKRMPIPSHDTYLWYVADRLHLPIKRTNFKRMRGMSNKSDLQPLVRLLADVDNQLGRKR